MQRAPISYFLVVFLNVGIIVSVAEVWAAEPTLARLSFWVPPERMAEFEAAYEKRAVPILKQHGLVESSERDERAKVDSIFSRLFEVKTPSEVEEKWTALWDDSAWREVLRDLGTIFGTTRSDDRIRNYFAIYTAPVGSGNKVAAGRGRGHWKNWGVAEGFPGNTVFCSLADTDGNLWFGTQNSGVSRYDGHTFTTFTTEDGLGHNTVWSIFQDRGGHLWFGWGGVSRYDGETFTIFTKDDGLVGNAVNSILQDNAGHLWFGGIGGVSRYDGENFTTGLAHLVMV